MLQTQAWQDEVLRHQKVDGVLQETSQAMEMTLVSQAVPVQVAPTAITHNCYYIRLTIGGVLVLDPMNSPCKVTGLTLTREMPYPVTIEVGNDLKDASCNYTGAGTVPNCTANIIVDGTTLIATISVTGGVGQGNLVVPSSIPVGSHSLTVSIPELSLDTTITCCEQGGFENCLQG